MDYRYSMVAEAADDTFDWIFDNPKKEMESNLDLVRPLKDWLDQGTGIFHVSAKLCKARRWEVDADEIPPVEPCDTGEATVLGRLPSIDDGELLLLETWKPLSKRTKMA